LIDAEEGNKEKELVNKSQIYINLTFCLRDPWSEACATNRNTYLSDVESNSTALTVLSGQRSSSNRRVVLQCFMLVFPMLLPSNGCFGTSNVRDFLENYFTPESCNLT
jgi:hypothetical protein